MKTNMRFKTLALAGLLIGQNSQAAIGRDCRPKAVQIGQTEIVSISGYGRSVSSMQKYGGSFSEIANRGDSIAEGIRSDLDNSIRGDLISIPEYQGHSVSVSGPVKMEIGNSNGARIVNATVGLGQVSFNSNFKKTKHILGVRISASCSITINMDQPKFIGSYDIDTNRMSFAQSQLNISHSQDCSTSFSWIPVFGGILDRLLNRKVDSKLESSIQRILNDRLSRSYIPGDFGGVRAALPSNVFILGDVDMGVMIREDFINLLTRNTISATFNKRKHSSASFYSSGFRLKKSEELFSLKFNQDQIAMSLTEEREFEVREPVGYGCIAR